MDLRFFADHCISNYIIEYLQKEEFEVLKLKDCLPTDSEDTTVMLKAQELNSILISLNGDFSDIVSYPPSKYKGIISLQIRNHPEIIPNVMNLLITYLKKNSTMKYYLGKLILVEAHRIRIRK